MGALYHELRQEPSVSTLLSLWLVPLPLIPLGALLMEAWDKLIKYLRPQTLSEQVNNQEAWLNHQSRRASQQALRQA